MSLSELANLRATISELEARLEWMGRLVDVKDTAEALVCKLDPAFGKNLLAQDCEGECTDYADGYTGELLALEAALVAYRKRLSS